MQSVCCDFIANQVLRGHMTSVRAVAFSTDGCHIASSSLDGDVKIWSAAKGVQVVSGITLFLFLIEFLMLSAMIMN